MNEHRLPDDLDHLHQTGIMSLIIVGGAALQN